MRYEAGQRFLTPDGRLAVLRSPAYAENTVRLCFVKACDIQTATSALFSIKDCPILVNPSRTAFIEYLNTLPWTQEYLYEAEEMHKARGYTTKQKLGLFGNWLRYNKFTEYVVMYAEWKQNQPWCTGSTEDKFI